MLCIEFFLFRSVFFFLGGGGGRGELEGGRVREVRGITATGVVIILISAVRSVVVAVLLLFLLLGFVCLFVVRRL